MSVQQRNFFRVLYPDAQQAYVLINHAKFKVLDLSQSGVRFSSPLHLPSLNQVFAAEIHLLTGYVHKTNIKVVKLMEKNVMAVFESQIEKVYMELEKTYLSDKHGNFASAKAY